jgi:hypothetical protein
MLCRLVASDSWDVLRLQYAIVAANTATMGVRKLLMIVIQ